MAGQLINGEWKTKDSFAEDDGSFQRDESAFRNWITAHGEEGPNAQNAVKAERGRYHLYVSYACPWAHRALIFRKLKKLEDIIPVYVVHPHMMENGWTFDTDFNGATGDVLHGHSHLHQLYTAAKNDYTGKVTVPVLWDETEKTIVNNESAEIIRIFNDAFNDLTQNDADFYPENLRNEIHDVNERIYNTLNNGVYKCGFAQKQEVYDENIIPLAETLDWLEQRLSANGPYLFCDRLTEADVRLFTTLIRFDPVYYVHFKCNVKQIREYDALNAYMTRMYDIPEIKSTVHFDQIKEHYYYSHKDLNPYQIIPAGPRDLL